VGGLPVKELNILELEFLRINNYNIFIPLEELQQYGDQLLMHAIREKEVQLKQEQRLMLEKYHQQQQSCITDYPFMYHIG